MSGIIAAFAVLSDPYALYHRLCIFPTCQYRWPPMAIATLRSFPDPAVWMFLGFVVTVLASPVIGLGSVAVLVSGMSILVDK